MDDVKTKQQQRVNMHFDTQLDEIIQIAKEYKLVIYLLSFSIAGFRIGVVQ